MDIATVVVIDSLSTVSARASSNLSTYVLY